MHSFVQRANVVVTYVATLAVVLCIVTAASELLHRSNPSVSVSLNEINRIVARTGGKDQAFITFSVDADLRSVFSWNTKQLFVFLQAEYTTKENSVNQVVLWDSIITSKEQAVIKAWRQNSKYAFVDRFRGLRGTPIRLTLAWNVMPYAGYFHTDSRSFDVGPLPDEYTA